MQDNLERGQGGSEVCCADGWVEEHLTPQIGLGWTAGQDCLAGEEEAKMNVKSRGDWQAQEGWKQSGSKGKWGGNGENGMSHEKPAAGTGCCGFT